MTLKKQLGQGTMWMSLAASGNSLVSFIIFIVLSRILTPADIGLVAFALIVVEVGKIIVNAGFAQAVVQLPQWNNVYASTCFYTNLIFATLISLIVIFVGAPLIAQHYQPEAGPILIALSVIFFIEGLKTVHEGKLKREFAFKVIALRTILAGLSSGAVGIYLALNDYGVWALVWQQIINQAVTTTVTLASTRWVPNLTFSVTDFKKLLKFSSPLMFAQLIGNVSTNVFELLIGMFLGPAALGFYRVAGRALYILQDIVLKPFEHTALSALSRISDRPTQAQATLRMIRMSAYLTLPIFFGAAAVAPEFIVFAFGEKWSQSGTIMMVLAIGIAPMVIGYQVNALLTASNNSRLVMIQAGVALFLNFSLASIAVPFGLLAMASAFALRNYLTACINLYMVKRTFGVSFLRMVKTLMPTFLASIMMFLIATAAKILFLNELPALLNILAVCILGAASYGLLMTTLFRSETKNFFKESMDLAPAKLKPLIATIQGFIKLT